MRMRMIIAGGGMYKTYNEVTGGLAFGEVRPDEMLKQARFSGSLVIERILMKDSWDMTAVDRERLVRACLNAPEDRMVVTHGTAEMVESAQLIAQSLKEPKTVVLTGARIPHSLATISDALFNLGTALAFAQSLPPGVYIAMNGRYFTSDNAQRDKVTGMFKELGSALESA